MKSYKIRHQLFLPEEISRRLEHLAQSGRARSEILVEALDTCFSLRQAPLREMLARIVVTGAMNPVNKVARAAGGAATATDDPTTRKLRSLQ